MPNLLTLRVQEFLDDLLGDSPPYPYGGRLLTVEDTVEFFSPIPELKLKEQEKKDLVQFIRAL